MNSISNNNVNFTARLDTTFVANKKRWSKIGKEFEKLTADYPDDIVLINGSMKNGDKIGINLIYDDYRSFQVELSSGATWFLSKYQDSVIAQKIKSAFTVLKKSQIMYDCNTKIMELLNTSKEVPDEIAQDYIYSFRNMQKAILEEERGKDPLIEYGMMAKE